MSYKYNTVTSATSHNKVKSLNNLNTIKLYQNKEYPLKTFNEPEFKYILPLNHIEHLNPASLFKLSKYKNQQNYMLLKNFEQAEVDFNMFFINYGINRFTNYKILTDNFNQHVINNDKSSDELLTILDKQKSLAQPIKSHRSFVDSYQLLENSILALDNLSDQELRIFFNKSQCIDFILNHDDNNNLIAVKFINTELSGSNNLTNIKCKPLAENIILNKSSENNSNKLKDYIMIYTNI